MPISEKICKSYFSSKIKEFDRDTSTGFLCDYCFQCYSILVNKKSFNFKNKRTSGKLS